MGDCSEADERPLSWAKVQMIAHYLESYEACLWIDADAIFVRVDKDVADTVPTECYQALAPHPYEWIAMPNAGVWFVRSCQRASDFLSAVWDSTDLIEHPWWEQAAIARLLGYGFGGPQGMEDDLSVAQGSPWLEGFSWLDPAWNTLSRSPHFPRRGERVRHHAAYLINRREAWMRVDAAFAEGRVARSAIRYEGTRAYYAARDAIHSGLLQVRRQAQQEYDPT
jgi:hypothetical protein